MLSSAFLPGIRAKPYIGGLTFTVGVDNIDKSCERPESRERLLDTYLTRDVPAAFTGQPDDLSRFVFALAWQSISEADYRTIERLRATAGFFDFCDWKPIIEKFSGNASTTTFSLMRRRALSYLSGGDLPLNAATVYATEVLVGGVSTSVTWGTVTAKGQSPFTFASAPASGSGNIEVCYVPLYKVIHRDVGKKFTLPHREAFSMTFEEI